MKKIWKLKFVVIGFILLFLVMPFSANAFLGLDFAPSEFGEFTLDKFMLKTSFDPELYGKTAPSQNAKGQLVYGSLPSIENLNPFGSMYKIITVDPETNKILALKIRFFKPGGIEMKLLQDWHKYYGQEVIARYGNPTSIVKDAYGYPVSIFREECKYQYVIRVYMANDKFERIPPETYEKQDSFGQVHTVLKGIAVFAVDIEAI